MTSRATQPWVSLRSCLRRAWAILAYLVPLLRKHGEGGWLHMTKRLLGTLMYTMNVGEQQAPVL